MGPMDGGSYFHTKTSNMGGSGNSDQVLSN